MKMVQGWKHYWWRRFSTWLAAINGIFVGYVFSQPVLAEAAPAAEEMTP